MKADEDEGWSLMLLGHSNPEFIFMRGCRWLDSEGNGVTELSSMLAGLMGRGLAM